MALSSHNLGCARCFQSDPEVVNAAVKFILNQLLQNLERHICVQVIHLLMLYKMDQNNDHSNALKIKDRFLSFLRQGNTV